MPTNSNAALNDVLSTIKAELASLDTTENRAELAHVCRMVLSKLALVVEGIPTNAIVHAGEVLLFGQIDALLAKIEQPALPTLGK